MSAYIIRRLLLLIPTLLIASLIIFFIQRIIPGNIIDLMAEQTGGFAVGEVDREALEHALGLDVPIHVQYGHWFGDIILHGSLGESLWRGTSVTDEIVERLPVTFELALLGIIISQLIAFPIGIYSGIRQDSWGDYLGRTFAIGLIAIPNFWLATMVIVFPSLWWGWSPPIKFIHFTDDPLGNLGMFIIPAAVLGASLGGTTMRMTRAMILEVLRQDYIRTAWAKGLRERTIIMRHALKNALIPVITILGLQLPLLVGGTVIIEQIFCIPGMGRLMLEAINARDYPMVSGVMIFVASFVLVANLLVDLTYAYLDPRIHYK